MRALHGEIVDDMPAQDLRSKLVRMPAIPVCRFVISNMRTRHSPNARDSELADPHASRE